MTDEMLSWLRRQIEIRKTLAEEAHAASWTFRTRAVERPDGGGDDIAEVLDSEDGKVLFSVYMPGPEPDEDDLAHIAFNDPRQVIADCEADLAIITEHYAVPGVHAGISQRVCTRCSDYGRPGEITRPELAPCRTVRLLAAGYAGCPGYRPDWAPEGTTP